MSGSGGVQSRIAFFQSMIDEPTKPKTDSTTGPQTSSPSTGITVSTNPEGMGAEKASSVVEESKIFTQESSSERPLSEIGVDTHLPSQVKPTADKADTVQQEKFFSKSEKRQGRILDQRIVKEALEGGADVENLASLKKTDHVVQETQIFKQSSEESPPLSEKKVDPNPKPELRRMPHQFFDKKVIGGIRAQSHENGGDVKDLSEPPKELKTAQRSSDENIKTISNALASLNKKTKLGVSLGKDGHVNISTKKRGRIGKAGKSQETKESMNTMLDVMEEIMRNGPENAKNEVFKSLRSINSKSWSRDVLKQNPQMKARFQAIKNNFPHLTIKPSSSDLNTFSEMVGKVSGDLESKDYKGLSDTLTEHSGTLKTILENSGMDPKKTVDISSRGRADLLGIPMEEFFGLVPSEHSGSAIIQDIIDHTQFLKDNPEEGYALTSGQELAAQRQGDREISSFQIFGRVARTTGGGPSVTTTMAKQLDRCVDGFCAKFIVDPERADKEGSDDLTPLQMTRNDMIQSRLEEISDFKDFMEDRSNINKKIMKILRADTIDPKGLEDVIKDIKAFEEKYKPLAEKHQKELQKIRSEIPKNIGFFTEKENIQDKPEYAEMLREYASKYTN